MFSFVSHTSDRIANTMLKLNEDYLHVLNVENFNVSSFKSYLGITSSSDQLEHSGLIEIEDFLNC